MLNCTRPALIAVLAAFLALLAACGVVTTEMSIKEKVDAIRDKTVELCGYLPKAGSVEHMLLASNPTTQGVEAIANAICSAMVAWQNSQKTGSAFATDCPRVNGVCVEGAFVDKPKGK